jgi:hypothetical protein
VQSTGVVPVGSVFFLAGAGIAAFAAKELGVFAEMAELIRIRWDKHDQRPKR